MTSLNCTNLNSQVVLIKGILSFVLEIKHKCVIMTAILYSILDPVLMKMYMCTVCDVNSVKESIPLTPAIAVELRSTTKLLESNTSSINRKKT